MVFKPQTFHETPRHSEMENPTAAMLESELSDALARTGGMDASRITVALSGTTAILSGFVGSPDELVTAGEVAGRVDGIADVDNRLQVQSGAG